RARSPPGEAVRFRHDLLGAAKNGSHTARCSARATPARAARRARSPDGPARCSADKSRAHQRPRATRSVFRGKEPRAPASVRVPLGVPRKRAARTSVRWRPARCSAEKSRAHQRPLASRRVVLGAVSRQSGARRELGGVVHTLRAGTRRTRAPPSYTGAMKLLYRPDLYAWSRFDEARNIDFHSVLWVREGGNVVIDPLPLSAHEQARLA